jgi:8-amino-7-oxononanoate synthase
LANHSAVIDAYKEAVDEFGVGSGSAHLICGHNTQHHALEEELAAFTGRDRALLFSTGYMANLGAISALIQPGDAVFEDRLNHASLLDGGLLSRARFKRYHHNDIYSLQVALQQSTAGKKLIATDGVFSMDGDLAILPALVKVAQQHQAGLLVDDAHGIGVLGKSGGGITQLYGFGQHEVPVLVGTLGKAFGTFGAFVAGSEQLIEKLIQQARTYIYTTALPPAIAAATRTSLRIIQTESWRREKLQALLQRFRSGAKQLGLRLMDSETPIQPVLVGDSRDALVLSRQLFEQGIWVVAIRPPTVPVGSARLRITFSAMHEPQHIDQLLDALDRATQ